MASALGIWIDRAAQDVWVDRQRLSPQLSPAQLNLIAALAARIDQVCSRAETWVLPDARVAEIPNNEMQRTHRV